MTSPADIVALKIGDSVKVSAISVTGRIVAIMDLGNGNIEYKVVYWWDGDRRSEWLEGWEIDRAA